MKFTPTAIPEVILVEPRLFGDQRGFFMETWQAEKFAAAGLGQTFVQDHLGSAPKGTLRGLRYQLGQPQGRLVRLLTGEAFYVAVDLRRSSPTFGRWVGQTISADNRLMLWVPPGFAHGFLVSSAKADFFCKCTDYYAPAQKRTIRWDDPVLNIAWPLAPGEIPVLANGGGDSFQDAEVYP